VNARSAISNASRVVSAMHEHANALVIGAMESIPATMAASSRRTAMRRGRAPGPIGSIGL